jgi:hypothetical protein
MALVLAGSALGAGVALYMVSRITTRQPEIYTRLSWIIPPRTPNPAVAPPHLSDSFRGEWAPTRVAGEPTGVDIDEYWWKRHAERQPWFGPASMNHRHLGISRDNLYNIAHGCPP